MLDGEDGDPMWKGVGESSSVNLSSKPDIKSLELYLCRNPCPKNYEQFVGWYLIHTSLPTRDRVVRNQ